MITSWDKFQKEFKRINVFLESDLPEFKYSTTQIVLNVLNLAKQKQRPIPSVVIIEKLGIHDLAKWRSETGLIGGILTVDNEYPSKLIGIENHWFVDKSAEGIVWHELGHLNHWKYNREWYTRKYNFSEDLKKYIIDNVSGYASTNSLEFAAEVFAGINGGKHKNYNKSIRDLYESILSSWTQYTPQFNKIERMISVDSNYDIETNKVKLITLLELKSLISNLGYNDLVSKGQKELGVIVPSNMIATSLRKISGALENLGIEVVEPNIIKLKIYINGPKDFIIRIRKKALQRITTNFNTNGTDNEKKFIAHIKTFLKDNEGYPIDIYFLENGKEFKIANVIKVEDVAHKVHSGNKADCLFITNDGKKVPLSIKQDNAGRWESVDSYWGEKGAKFLVYAVTTNQVELNQLPGGVWHITPQMAIKASDEEVIKVCFGKDIIRDHGAIIKRTFKQSDFKWDKENNTLYINVSNVIMDLNDMKALPNYYPYMEISNYPSRNVSAFKLRGLRPQAIPKFNLVSSGEKRHMIFGDEVRQWID